MRNEQGTHARSSFRTRAPTKGLAPQASTFDQAPPPPHFLTEDWLMHKMSEIFHQFITGGVKPMYELFMENFRACSKTTSHRLVVFDKLFKGKFAK